MTDYDNWKLTDPNDVECPDCGRLECSGHDGDPDPEPDDGIRDVDIVDGDL